jgi:hypothetical protein
MDRLTVAVHDRLASDAELVGLLASYKGGPAVFTDDRVPRDASMPYVVSSGNVADEAWDTKTSTGRRVTRDLGVYAPQRQTATVERAAERCRVLFHRHRLTVAGFGTVTARVSGPIRMSADEYDGRVLTLRFMFAGDADG